MSEPARTISAVRTHLEMRDRSALRAATRPDIDVSLEQEHVSPAEYRALYSAVGHDWHWFDRLVVPDEELAAYFASPDVQVWVLRVSGDVAGYFELKRHDGERVEIVYFGLLAEYF